MLWLKIREIEFNYSIWSFRGEKFSLVNYTGRDSRDLDSREYILILWSMDSCIGKVD